MDSLSQIVLGASVAQLALGRQLGKRALIVGAVLGTLPDLDVLVPYADAVESFTYHRSWSHSVFVLSLVSIPFAWLIQRLFSSHELSYTRSLLGVWLILITHPLLDGFTTYGTQMFWPLMPPPTAWGSVFIIDPLYTLPLVIGLVFAWTRSYLASRTIVASCLALSTMYLTWTLVAQSKVQEKLERTIARLNIDASQILVAPFPLSVLWRTVVSTEEHYYEGYSSLLDDEPAIALTRYDNGKNLCKQWQSLWPVEQLDWFTRGLFALHVEDNKLIASDLRIGVEGSYIFRFVIAEHVDQQWQAVQARALPVKVDTNRVEQLLNRAVDESVRLEKIERETVAIPLTCES